MSQESVSLSPKFCRERQLRLATFLAQNQIQAACLTRPEHVQYLTTYRPAPVLQAVVIITADSKTFLCAPNSIPDDAVCDDAVAFEAQWRCTLRQEQLQAALSAIPSHWTPRAGSTRWGVEGSLNLAVHPAWSSSSGLELVDIEPELWRLRRRKDPDELAMIRKAIDCTTAMYRRAREIIAPGVTELEVYNQLQAAAVLCAGETLTGFGNDFQCNSPGGSPRNRKAQAGELFILDLGPAYRGYYADNCRTFAVQGPASDEQLRAWRAIVDVLELVEKTVRPGVSTRELFTEAKVRLDAVLPEGFFHHLGHGIGLWPHEAPHLNDRWDDTFEVGDVFTAEPGLYAPELKAGIRLEQNYLVTESGVERLTDFPLDL
ncbi:M24 family metallopeptidase [Planctomicrobium sp. SH661]|uniref:M24 family metallopeptidase n=1 Tax=Planctomicrobium sp. SH661 TaxID=3448124 RepID=UPI003F5B3BCE